MTLSRTNAMPHWSTWLSDWVRDDGAEIQVVQEAQGVPTENGSSENKINDGVTDNAPLVLHPVEDMLQ